MEQSADPKQRTKQEDAAETVARDATRPEQIRQGPHLHPLVDVVDREDEILLRADMPGVAADGIDVRFENGILILAGKTRQRAEEPRGELFREFVPMDYYREFTVGESVDREHITAEYDAGVLTLHLPKSPSTKPRRIEVRKK
jgi:HSP20 family molecular chaperone IbpA